MGAAAGQLYDEDELASGFHVVLEDELDLDLDVLDLDDDGYGDEGDEASGVRVPMVADPRWFGWTRPLYDFICAADRSWGQLIDWGRDNGVRGEMLRHRLAALEWRGDALTVGLDTQLRWRGVGFKARPRKDTAAA
jgi:hypothetical protein